MKGAPSLSGTTASISWSSLLLKEFPPGDFILEPYIPRVGKVLLYGDSSIGKSPLTWHIAACVSEGLPFFGLPTKKSKVLFIELDSTERGTYKRLLKYHGPVPEQVQFLFLPGLNLPHPPPEQVSTLMEAIKASDPELVIINPLLKTHDLDDRESKTVKAVYDWFDKMLPGRALLFVHHEKKGQNDPSFHDPAHERFSGNKNWFNLAQASLHLQAHRGKGFNLKLWHRKAQESELLKAMPLNLSKDGTNLTCPMAEELDQIKAFLTAHPSMSAREADFKLSKILSLSERTVRSRRLVLDSGLYPGPLWLGLAAEPHSADTYGDGEKEGEFPDESASD